MILARSIFFVYWTAIMILFGGGSGYVAEAFVEFYVPAEILAGPHTALSLNTWIYIAVFTVFSMVSCVGAYFLFVAPIIVLFPKATKSFAWERGSETERKFLKKLYEALDDER